MPLILKESIFQLGSKLQVLEPSYSKTFQADERNEQQGRQLKNEGEQTGNGRPKIRDRKRKSETGSANRKPDAQIKVETAMGHGTDESGRTWSIQS